MMRTLTVMAATALLFAEAAFAHVTVWPQQSRAGVAERYTVRVSDRAQYSHRVN
jgi:uncharacterized protein YcnI